MKRRFFLLAIPVALIGMTFMARPQVTKREEIEKQLPELHLLVRQEGGRNYNGGGVAYLYTGRADPEVIADRLASALTGRGWKEGKRKAGSAFPYSNQIDSRPWQPLWHRFHIWIPFFGRPLGPLDVRVLKGRAGAEPDGAPWTTVLIREGTREVYPDQSEPILGKGVRF